MLVEEGVIRDEKRCILSLCGCDGDVVGACGESGIVFGVTACLELNVVNP